MNHTHEMPEYARKRSGGVGNRWNGAYYYSLEIVEHFIPNVVTDRPWVTVNVEGHCEDRAIVFVHNNQHPERYRWLSAYSDLVLVCGVPGTCRKVAHLGTPVYLPLSVDVAYVERFRCAKDRGTAFVGRRSKACFIPHGTEVIAGMPREKMLGEMARYERVYAVGRCAIEARILGCEVLPHDPRYPDPSVWRVLDSRDAAAMLQVELDRIDGRR